MKVKKKVLLTGNAGFIGYHVGKRLVQEGYNVFGMDNLNDYYDVNFKINRLKDCGFRNITNSDQSPIGSSFYSNYFFQKIDLENKDVLNKVFEIEKFDIIIHLAAQAGVRYSIDHPEKYIQSNIIGFHNILEKAKEFGIKHFIYASSSSIYGLNANMPLSVNQKTDLPINMYAVTKKSNELMAHAYSNLFKLPTTGLRFFTVYGPWGRPDMAISLFADAIINKKAINVFNFGEMERDFTYIDDIVESIFRLIPEKSLEEIPYQIFNIGNGKPVNLLRFINSLEEHFNYRTEKVFFPLQSGDIVKTWADTSDLEAKIKYKPQISIEEGTRRFVEWYKYYYNLK